MEQSHGRCGGKCVAASLLNTSLNDWYSGGRGVTWCVTGLSMVVEQIERLVWLEIGTGRSFRHPCLHPLFHLRISPDLQSMVGWCLESQGRPRTTSTTASSSTSSEILSVWKHPMRRLTSGVRVTHQPLAQRFSLDSGDLVGGVVPATGNFESSEGARGDEISRSSWVYEDFDWNDWFWYLRRAFTRDMLDTSGAIWIVLTAGRGGRTGQARSWCSVDPQ